MPESFSFFGRDPLNLIRIMPAQGLGIMSKAAVSPKRDAVFYFMRLTINGEIKDNILATSLKELLEELGIISGRVAVEVNTQVIKKTDYESFRLNDGDIVEIVSFVGGG